ncbi:MAG: hypothetical protein IPF99_32485 [Deltaproteobacteria bacterium]|nr:hypothetical protein [Deltaproteobacteria bacterium]
MEGALQQRAPRRVRGRRRETGFALLGRTFTRDDGPGLSPHLGTSLVPTWTSLFRPRKNGRTALDDAALGRSAEDESSRAARQRLTKAG